MRGQNPVGVPGFSGDASPKSLGIVGFGRTPLAKEQQPKRARVVAGWLPVRTRVPARLLSPEVDAPGLAGPGPDEFHRQGNPDLNRPEPDAEQGLDRVVPIPGRAWTHHALLVHRHRLVEHRAGRIEEDLKDVGFARVRSKEVADAVVLVNRAVAPRGLCLDRGDGRVKADSGQVEIGAVVCEVEARRVSLRRPTGGVEQVGDRIAPALVDHSAVDHRPVARRLASPQRRAPPAGCA